AFDSDDRRGQTVTGVTVEEAVEALTAAGASAIGANCGLGPERMLETCRRLRAATYLPIWLKPNAGLPVIVDGKAVYSLSPGKFAEASFALVDAGADFIGGCCGSGPEHIAALGSLLAQRR